MTTFDCTAFSSRLVIDLDAVRGNYRAIREHASAAACGAVVKANAYGLGARRIASTLHREGCRIFFVAQLSEAVELHDALPPGCTIVILNGLDPGGESLCAEKGLVPVLNSLSQVERWRAAASTQKNILPACLQIETGMSRLGLPAPELRKIAEDASFAEHIDLRMIMSHLACADEPDAGANAEQLGRFHELAGLFPDVPRSIANSFGTVLSNAFHLEIVRPGIALYGVPLSSTNVEIAPISSLSVRVLQLRELEAGTGVGYNLTYRASTRRRIATLGIGYADGWPRSLSNAGAAWHGDVRLPIVGRVSMDSMMVDVSAIPPDGIREGDFVDLIGPSQTLSDVAADAGTIPYEILTRLGARHARFYIEDGVMTSLMPGEAK